jgi:hypothetical protein
MFQTSALTDMIEYVTENTKTRFVADYPYPQGKKR